jgi:hypothetical protein
MRQILITLISFIMLGILSSCQSWGWGTELSTPVFPPPYQIDETAIPTPHPTLTPIDTQAPTKTPLRTPTPTKFFVPTSTPTLTNTVISISAKYPGLVDDIDQIITQAGGRWQIIIKEVDGPTLFSSLPEQRIDIASVVKIPFALLFFQAMEEKGIPEDQLAEHLQSTGVGGRTFDQLLYAMLVKSEERATEILVEYIPAYVNIPSQMAEWELQRLDLVSRRYTAKGVAEIFERLYQGEFVSATARGMLLAYLSEYTPNDDHRIGVLSDVLPEGYQIFNKRGSLLTPYVIADCAIIESPEETDYVLVIFASQGEQKTTYEVLDQALGEIAMAFWQHISAEAKK